MDARTARDKIEKSIALGSSANENESVAALDKAAELLEKYSKDLNAYDRERLADEIHRKRERIKYNRTLKNFFTELKTVSYKEALNLCRKVQKDFSRVKDDSRQDDELMEDIQKQLLFYKATVENPKRIRELVKAAKKEDIKSRETNLKEARVLAEEMIGTPSEDRKIIAAIDRKLEKVKSQKLKEETKQKEDAKRQTERSERKDRQRPNSEYRQEQKAKRAQNKKEHRKERIQNREWRQFERRANRNSRYARRCARRAERPALRMAGGSTLKVLAIIGTISCFFWAVVFSLTDIAMISGLVSMIRESGGFVWATMYNTLLLVILPIPLYVGGGLLRWVRNNPLAWFKPL